MHAAPRQAPRAPVPPMLRRAAPRGLKGTVAAAESNDKTGGGPFERRVRSPTASLNKPVRRPSVGGPINKIAKSRPSFFVGPRLPAAAVRKNEIAHPSTRFAPISLTRLRRQWGKPNASFQLLATETRRSTGSGGPAQLSRCHLPMQPAAAEPGSTGSGRAAAAHRYSAILER
jgi:hypothetical protein